MLQTYKGMFWIFLMQFSQFLLPIFQALVITTEQIQRRCLFVRTQHCISNLKISNADAVFTACTAERVRVNFYPECYRNTPLFICLTLRQSPNNPTKTPTT